MPTRSYVSEIRDKAAAEKRARVIQAAVQYLRGENSVASFSLDAIAKAAEVTRLTVYNQFGSRRGLLEAAFDEIAMRGNLGRIGDAMANPDPYEGLDMVIEIFCGFWGSDPAVARLHDAMVIDPEFAEALLARNERRRILIGELLTRMTTGRATESERRDAVDLIFALTSCAMFRMLAATRSTSAVCAIVKSAARAAVARLESAT